ncbi:hypothetical protein NBO_31g0002 [Nosema bombycis CQ1]|uniref:Uncharacterized protein n=1 Tax=Nosema bombycis (strain CQ1 / CVCC 102059) TaxID=578461 RepID=R0KVP4_NOSB1|nr:hypothetical protein NBO_31g0002 [Nosema bombycis CQ1]|eukprot:EOB14282.1 hypothetical protein NBO_31g0002 [Nosema bombycis CQ1]
MNHVFLKENEQSKSLNYFLEEDFLTERKKKMPYFHFTNYVRTKWKLNEKEIIDILFTFFKSHGLNLGWLHKKTPLCNESLLILLDLKNERNFEDKKGIKNLKNLLSLHLKRLKVDCLMVKKRKWSEDEYVRLINGAIRHHSSPNMFINNDLVYNFFLTQFAKCYK